MSRTGWTICTITAAIMVGLAVSMEPWKQFKAEAAETERAQDETRAAEKQRSDLLQQSAQLESPYGMEEQARDEGFRQADERPLDLD